MEPPTIIPDAVPRDGPGAREIGFALPDRYNASAVLFDNLARGHGDRIAVRSVLGTWTYARLCAEACRYGNAFRALGLERGARILFLLNDTPAYPAAFFGAIRAGFVPVLVNTLSPPDLVRFYLEDTAAAVVIADADNVRLLTPDAIAGTALRTLVVVNGEARPTHVPRVEIAERWLASHFPSDLAPADTHRDEMAFWMYSSGSTGRPKGIVHLQHDMAYTHASYARHVLALTPDDICFSVPKVFFAYGLGNAFTFPFCVGASAVLWHGRPDPSAVFAQIAEFAPTVLFGLPTLYTALVKAPEAATARLGSLRLCISAAEILSAEVADAWRRLSGHEIVEGLGSTEVLHIYLSNRPGRTRRGAAGLRVPGYEVRLVDPAGAEVSDGEEGILMVRGDSAAPLYWRRPDKTAETMRDGWIWTGDRFVRDADGFHYFRGRADDLVKVAGQWVYPLEVELCLAEHPAVRECAVLAHELADRRTTLTAFVALNDPAAASDAQTAALQAFVKARLLPYKYPRQVRYLAELPKTGTGKIDRQGLKALVEEP